MADIRNYTPPELQNWFVRQNVPSYRGLQVFDWLYKSNAGSFCEMKNLPLDLQNKLKENFSIGRLRMIKELTSKDGTKKFLFRLFDDNLIESVFIPAKGRNTACISSQAGCPFSCRFCASGLSGFRRNLETWEIIGQIMQINQVQRITHVVFMGTGEPLDNYDNVLKAVRIINSKEGLNIGARRITISTCGIVPAIKRLAQENLQFELSVSLHAADEKTRELLMPVNKKYPLRELIPALREYAGKTGRQVTFEYVLIADVNSSRESADRLVHLLKGWETKVNLIPYNPAPGLPYMAPGNSEIRDFSRRIKDTRIPVTVRAERGRDIQGACGQLRAKLMSILLLFTLVSCGQKDKQVCFNKVCVKAEFADTHNKRMQGLMSRDNLPENSGMLFMFDEEERYSFWMKNMKFPLDIIWINRDKKIIDVKLGAPVCGENCESFIPSGKILYALEVNAGFVEKNNIRAGDEVIIRP